MAINHYICVLAITSALAIQGGEIMAASLDGEKLKHMDLDALFAPPTKEEIQAVWDSCPTEGQKLLSRGTGS